MKTNTDFMNWWLDKGLAEFAQLAASFDAPINEDTIVVAKMLAWEAWCVSGMSAVESMKAA